jgi:hypothetical protein
MVYCHVQENCVFVYNLGTVTVTLFYWSVLIRILNYTVLEAYGINTEKKTLIIIKTLRIEYVLYALGIT